MIRNFFLILSHIYSALSMTLVLKQNPMYAIIHIVVFFKRNFVQMREKSQSSASNI